MKRKLKPDAVPTIDLSLAGTADTIDQSLTDRVTINNVEENMTGRYVELVDWKWPTSKGKL